MAPSKNYQYERFKKNVQLLKSNKFWRSAPIAKLLGIDTGNFSRYINGVEPSVDTLNKFNHILEEKLKEVIIAEDPLQKYDTQKKVQIKELDKMLEKIDELRKKVDRILVLMEKKDKKGGPSQSN